ncbi:PAS domain S-box protein [Marinomonas balearica]|uniref:Sensory/regulatory protein RpfC n=1 Tax=Marinomonas balearica TaxID=491947 RepID=A0A4V6PTT6_9GAMM|nr:PAS domain S-box protein [Marinomonas balearica]TDO96832.1 PAS domain S-box-containing protein [Marinomonas balearica]
MDSKNNNLKGVTLFEMDDSDPRFEVFQALLVPPCDVSGSQELHVICYDGAYFSAKTISEFEIKFGLNANTVHMESFRELDNAILLERDTTVYGALFWEEGGLDQLKSVCLICTKILEDHHALNEAKLHRKKLNNMTQMMNSLPLSVAYYDTNLQYEFMNHSYQKAMGLNKNEWEGLRVPDVVTHNFDAVQPLLERVKHEGSVDELLKIKPISDDSIKFVHAYYASRLEQGELTGYFVSLQDQTSLRRMLDSLKELHLITSDYSLSLKEKLQKILQLGCDQYSLPYGIISQIEDQDYIVRHCYSPDGELEDDSVFPLGDSYCIHTLENSCPTAFHNVGESEIKEHPCYLTFQLESYIGVQVVVNGQSWGTINFSGPERRSTPFQEDEYELIQLFGTWVGNEITRELSHQTLREVEAKQRSIFESAHDGIIGIDTNGKISFVNHAAQKLVSYSQDELTGQPFMRYFYSVDKRGNEFDPCVISTTLMERRNTSDRRVYLKTKNDKPIAISFSLAVMKDELGTYLGAVFSFQDCSDQVQFERQLFDQIQLFKSLFVDAPEAVVVADNRCLIQMVNPAFCQLYGATEEYLIGTPLQALYADSDNMLFEIPDELSDDMPLLQSSQATYQMFDGSELVLDSMGSILRDKEGDAVGFILHLRDVTEKLRAEAEIFKGQSRLSMAADSAGIGTWSWDVTTNQLEIDDWMYRIFGFEEKDVDETFDKWKSFVFPEDYENLLSEIETLAAAQSELLDSDYRIVRPDGQVRYIKVNAKMIYNDQGRLSQLIGANLDITTRKETELVLQKAKEQAELTSNAKSDFLATMSHEIRTPLNGVLGMAELMSHSKLSPEQQTQLDVIRDSGEGLLELIDEILDFSKIEAGHLMLESIDFNLEKAIFDIAHLLIVKAEDKGIELLVEFEQSCPRMLIGDVHRIKQIVTNLVSNAIKFTHQGEVVIQVSGTPLPSGDVDLTLCVKDTGIGIEKKRQESLFRAFTQADSSTTRQYGGTGLGLAITLQLTNLMDGEISVDSEVGKGSRFSVSMALPKSLLVESVEKETATQSLKGKKVLVVDDNETNLKIMEKQLLFNHLDVCTESSSSVALTRVIDSASTQPFEILVLDYLMPSIDGIMLANAIRSTLPADKQPIILIASSAGQISRDALLNANVNACISKPMSGFDLIAGLNKAYENEQVLITDHDIKAQVLKNDHKTGRKYSGKVLVAEDMLANMAVVRGMLLTFGVEVIEASNGQEAIEQWKEHKPSLILMDLHMPVLDGFEAMRRIRYEELQTNECVPIYALTADAQSKRLLDVKRAGGNGLISKPFQRKDLVVVIDQSLGLNERFIERVESPQSESKVGSDGESDLNEVIDLTVIEGLKEALGGDVSILIDAFIADAENIFQGLDSEAVIHSNDNDVLYKAAHSFKSISANVGAKNLEAKSKEYEALSRDGSIENIQPVVSDLKREYEAAITAFKAKGVIE